MIAALVLAASGCAQVEEPTWSEPTLSASSSGAELDGVAFADLGEAAEFGGLVLLGEFVGEPEIVSISELFPEDPMSVGSPAAAAARRIWLWRFEVTGRVAGGDPMVTEYLVMSEPVETDVAGVVEDPGRVLGQKVVLILDGVPRETTRGVAHFTLASAQAGASFAVVNSDGRIILDPAGNMGLPPGAEYAPTNGNLSDEELVEAVREQLQLP